MQKPITRRELVRATSAIGISAVASQAAALGGSVRIMPVEHREVIIIGSGFGGAITALRLTQQGIAVTMIEQGRRWDQPLAAGKRRFSPNIYPDGRSTWLSRTTVLPMGPALPIRRSTGVLQGRSLAGKTVLNGAAYGGGSITWGGVMVKPEEHIFRQIFPTSIRYEELEPHFAEISRRLGRSAMPADVLAAEPFRHVRLTQTHGEKAGLKIEEIQTATNWDIVRAELAGQLPASVTVGEAVYGVENGAKGGLDRTYLKEAEDSGLLEVKTLHQVQDLSINNHGHYVLSIDELDEDGRVIAKHTYTCAKLFLAAGSVTTSSLLVKAKATGKLPALNEHIGAGWGNNGNAYALRWPLPDSTGRIQGGPPALGINALDHELTPLFIEHPQLPLGFDLHGLLFFAIGITPTRGRFRYDAAKDSVVIDWPKHDAGQEKVNAALLDVLERMNRVNGGSISSVLTLFRKKVKDDICYHPLGGVVLGQAADDYGRVHGYSGLYVNDSAMLPGASGCCNPSMTISALAERNIAQVLEHDFS